MELDPSTPLLGRLQESVPQFLRPVEFRVVQTLQELKTALGLVYREYLKRNYTQPNPACLKLSIYHALPTTTTFLALHRSGRVLGTISLIVDSPLGLPMDEVYKLELDRLRKQGLVLAETGLLALDTELFGKGIFTMFHAKKLLLTLRLFKVMFDYLRARTNTDELVACFNPKHEILYDFLQLKPLGGLKSYTAANGNPALAKHLNVAETQRRAPAQITQLFYGATPSSRAFSHKLLLSPEDLHELFVSSSNIFASASPTELAHIRSCYPQYAFDQILHRTSPPAPNTELPRADHRAR